MAETTQSGFTPAALVSATDIARQTAVHNSPNGIRFATFGDIAVGTADPETEIARLVQAVPTTIAAALNRHVYYFVPLALAEPLPASPRAAPTGHRTSREETRISPIYTPELADQAICHRNVELPAGHGSSQTSEGVFISTRLLSDRFSLAFELFINVGHAFVDTAGVPESFSELAWKQALADVRGETSQDAWESRALSLTGGENPSSLPASHDGKPRIDEKCKTEFLEAAFADAIAVYLLSLAVDFDYSELREREYPLLAPQALADRLRLIARLFPANPSYEFSIRYRRRA